MTTAGERNIRVRFETPTVTVSSGDGQSTAWTTLASRWVKRTAQPSAETNQKGQISVERYTLRGPAVSGLTTACRCIMRSGTYQITGIVDLDSGEQEIEVSRSAHV